MKSVLLMTAMLASAVFSHGGEMYPPVGDGDGTRLPGKFVWADLVTDDLPASTAFYRELFGWSFRDADGYGVAENNGIPVAGMVERSRPEGSEAKPRWFGYISVEDVAAAERQVKHSGGRVAMPPRTFPGRGEQAVFFDAEGALFGVIHAEGGDPGDYAAEVGDWIWIQLWSRDAQAAANFYSGVAGYELYENPVVETGDAFILSAGGYARAAVRTLPADHPAVQPTWLPFVRVENLSETLARAGQLGGKVLIAPRPELHEGRLAVVADPRGASIGLMEWDMDAAEGEE